MEAEKIRRRSRFKRVTPETPFYLTERDHLWIEKIKEHGPLPSSYLRAFSRSRWVNDAKATRRLAALYDHKYLSRPYWQKQTLNPLKNFVVYDIATLDDEPIDDQTPLREDIEELAEWKHRLMVACITASIEIECPKYGITYLPKSYLLGRANRTNLRFDVTIEHPETHKPMDVPLIPDGLFALQYPDGSYRAFFVEADRNTVPNSTTNFRRKSHLRNLLQYREFIGNKLYKEELNLTCGALVLNVTKGERHLHNLLHVTKSNSANGINEVHCYHHIDGFGTVFKPPEVFEKLLGEEWQRAGTTPFAINNI